MPEIKVSVNYDESMLLIEREDTRLFYGNFHDFNVPQNIIELLLNIGHTVECDFNLSLIG